MKKIRIVSDSSSDVVRLEDVDFISVPLTIHTQDREFPDMEETDVEEMATFLDQYSGRSTTSCPNVEDWYQSFGEAEEIFCLTITSTLSGSYNAACTAANTYMEKHPGRRVQVIDTLSTGPEMRLILEKMQQSLKEGLSFEEIAEAVRVYREKTGLLFVLESMKNLANNGRVSKLVASLAGMMHIRVVGRASDQGDLEPLDKPRGAKNTLKSLLQQLNRLGYRGGKLRIDHCMNENAATALRDAVLALYPKADIQIAACRVLCSFYAQKGGLLIGYEAQ